MKRIFLLIVVPALLVTLGFAQTPAASGTTDQINIKGCLGGSDGNYTVAEDSTGKIFKITTSSADLKPHVGHDVTLIGHKTVAAENSVDITEVNMISEHCTAAAAAPAETTSALPSPPAAPAAPAETVGAPSESAIAPSAAAAAPDASASAPAETVATPPAPVAAPASAPAATVAKPSETGSAPAATVPAAAPDAIVSTRAKTASEPAATAAVHRAQPSAQHLKAAATPVESVSTPAADKVVPIAPDVPSPETASTPTVPTKAAPKTSAIRSAGMLVSIIVVLLLGAGVPLFLRWRRRKLADETKGENLSFTSDAKTDPGKTDTTGGRKAA